MQVGVWGANTRRDKFTRGPAVAGIPTRMAVPVLDPDPRRAGWAMPAEVQPEKGTYRGSANLYYASASGSRRALWTSDAALEPQDGSLSVRGAQRHPHHRSTANGTASSSRHGGGPRYRRWRRTGAVCRHQAPSLGSDRRGRQALRSILRQSPLARRHDDQLANDFKFHQTPTRRRGSIDRGGRRRPDQERNASPAP